MINPHELGLSNSQVQFSNPEGTDEEIRRVLRDKIEKEKKSAQEARIRNWPAGQVLFFLKGYRVPEIAEQQQRLQDLAFGVMTEYGLNPEIHEPGHKRDSFVGRGRFQYSGYGDIRTHELDTFPSQTIPNLVFERILSYPTTTRHTDSVMWLVTEYAHRGIRSYLQDFRRTIFPLGFKA